MSFGSLSWIKTDNLLVRPRFLTQHTKNSWVISLITFVDCVESKFGVTSYEKELLVQIKHLLGNMSVMFLVVDWQGAGDSRVEFG